MLLQKVLFHPFLWLSNKYSINVYGIAQLVKNPLAIQETPVQFLGQEDLLKKATHSSILGLPWWLSW